ncbi:MAG: hypothetical protein K8S15_05685 [Candidatus Aegiribacteria sp.]|nr:hypothetical protein [Candidatus Aegiribacteria sp.]
MIKVIFVLAFTAVFAYAIDNCKIENPVAGGTGTLDWFQYDDGIAYWISSGSAFYGTWFDITDFVPGAGNYECDYTEWWFYHHSNHPWDTDQIVVELWNGDDASGPLTNLTSDVITALHYAPVIVNYATPVPVEHDFWMSAITTVYSVEGLPSVLYDQYDNWTGTAHSFNDMGPVVMGGYEVDALFRAGCTWVGLELENESWGAIKGLFR